MLTAAQRGEYLHQSLNEKTCHAEVEHLHTETQAGKSHNKMIMTYTRELKQSEDQLQKWQGKNT